MLEKKEYKLTTGKMAHLYLFESRKYKFLDVFLISTMFIYDFQYIKANNFLFLILSDDDYYLNIKNPAVIGKWTALPHH